jgi:hypothetical protein
LKPNLNFAPSLDLAGVVSTASKPKAKKKGKKPEVTESPEADRAISPTPAPTPAAHDASSASASMAIEESKPGAAPGAAITAVPFQKAANSESDVTNENKSVR